MKEKKRSRKLLSLIKAVLCLTAGIAAWYLTYPSEHVQAASEVRDGDFIYRPYKPDPYIDAWSVEYVGSEENVVIPSEYNGKKVRRLGPDAFAESSGLKSVTLPKTIWYVENNAFEHCESLEEILVDENNSSFLSKDGVLYESHESGNILQRCPQGRQGMFSIPEGICKANVWAFHDCKGLRSLYIPASMGEIDLSFPSTLQNIYYAKSRSDLENLKGYYSLADTADTAHIHCDFNPNMYEYTILPDNTMEISKYQGNDSDLAVPAGLENKMVSSIQAGAFSNCQSLVNVDIPDNITHIGAGAFSGCSALTRVIVPAGVTSLAEDTFRNCPLLKEIYYAGSKEQWEKLGVKTSEDTRIIYNCNPHDFLFGFYITKLGANISRYIGNATNPVIPAWMDGRQVDGIGNGSSNIFPDFTPECIEISDGITKISPYAFQNCTGLREIRLPETLQSIGQYAFEGCSNLTDLEMFSGVSNLGQYAFKSCTSLGTVSFSDNITLINCHTFEGCANLSSLTLPKNLETIGENAFSGCTGLTDISIPQSITHIQTNAFQNCTALQTVHFGGDGKQWKNFASSGIASGNSNLLNANFQYTEEYLGEPSGYVTVSFNTWGVADISSQTVLQFEHITKPADPIRPGYIFQGWYSGEDAWDFEFDRVRSNLTLEARWTDAEEVQVIRGEFVDKEGFTLIPIGKEFILTAVKAIYPRNITYHWSSDSPIVTLGPDGNQTATITGNREGKCTVTCAVRSEYWVIPPFGNDWVLGDVDTTFDTFKFRVTPYVTSIEITEPTVTLTPGTYHPLSVTTVPAGNYARTLSGFHMTSSDESVVSVSQDGILAAKGLGTATITAYTTTGPDGTTCSATCTVTVGESSHDSDTERPSGNDSNTGHPSGNDPSSSTENNSTENDSENPGKKTIPKKGTVLKSGKNHYKVTKAGSSVAFVKTTSSSSSINIPKTVKIDGVSYKVTSIAANAFKNNKKLTKVTVGNNVASIGDSAFAGCKKLSRITIGTGLKKVGKYTFKNCTKLKSVTFRSKNLSSVGKNAFQGVHSSTKIYVPSKKLALYKKLIKGKFKFIAR